jgi:hypothetical protein
VVFPPAIQLGTKFVQTKTKQKAHCYRNTTLSLATRITAAIRTEFEKVKTYDRGHSSAQLSVREKADNDRGVTVENFSSFMSFGADKRILTG